MADKRKELAARVTKKQVRAKIETELPHLFGINPYKWQVEYWQDANRMKFICAGNQVGKSASQICHVIDLATNDKMWPKFFPKREPQVFWYIYPSKAKIEEEFNEKWVKEFLPKGSMLNHLKYGWHEFKVDHEFAGIKFNSGVAIYFKSWGQDLQAGTIDGVFADEELPKDIYPELDARLTATQGMFSMVFTATLNQPFWFDVIERRGKRGEKFPQASKWQISMEYDCRHFADGSPSHFTEDFVNKKKNSIGDPAEVDRRVHGRFVTSEGRKFKTFSRANNIKPPMVIPSNWELYGGVDIGTGGEGHPPAISIVAVRPDFKYGRMIRFWKGNDGSNYTSSQVLNKYIAMTLNLRMTNQFYDWHSKEFYLRSVAAGLSFAKAEKSHEVGDDLLSTLFKNQLLDLEECEQVDDLATEFETLKKTTPKRIAEDDGIDSLRYAIASLPWDLSDITSTLIEIEDPDKKEVEADERVANAMKFANRNGEEDEEKEWNYENEFDSYNEILEIAGDYYDDDVY